MQQGIFTILDQTPVAAQVYRLTLSGDTGAITAPGQFVDLRLPGFYLRRPLSVCDWEKGSLTLIYKTVGEGTRALSRMKAGEALDLLTGLGNGFSDLRGTRPLLVGGGVGAPPLYALARRLRREGRGVTVLLGFAGKDDVFYADEFRSLGAKVLLASQDGSVGTRGTVIDALREEAPDFDSLYACGPIPMLRALYDFTDVPAQFSFEERMGCGFGACMGCTILTASGPKRVCKDGPVFAREEILWRT